MRMRIFSLLMLIIFGGAIQVFGQERIIDEKEFGSRLSNSARFFKDIAYRSTLVSEGSPVKGLPANKYTSITEYAPPDRRHSTFIRTNSSGVEVKTETITIGESEWVRTNDGPWRELTGEGRGSGSGRGSGTSATLVERLVEYKVISGERVGGETADLYRHTLTLKFTSETGDFQSISTRNNWFGADGRLLRSENITADGEGKISYRTSTTYEYDPNIRIEAPIPPKVSKENQ